MKELIEEYKKAITRIDCHLIGSEHASENINVIVMQTTRSCYRAFIAELERIEKEVKL